ncbi:MAG: hypothetical protein GF334_06000 [Candidatus Altiarchaeales archaeon]|nr:hypothetical protein [Candidatus Altiarchaeales archaeon]
MQEKKKVCYFKGKNPQDEDVAAIAIKTLKGENEVLTTLSPEKVANEPETQMPPGVSLYLRGIAEKIFEFRRRTESTGKKIKYRPPTSQANPLKPCFKKKPLITTTPHASRWVT